MTEEVKLRPGISKEEAVAAGTISDMGIDAATLSKGVEHPLVDTPDDFVAVALSTIQPLPSAEEQMPGAFPVPGIGRPRSTVVSQTGQCNITSPSVGYGTVISDAMIVEPDSEMGSEEPSQMIQMMTSTNEDHGSEVIDASILPERGDKRVFGPWARLIVIFVPLLTIVLLIAFLVPNKNGSSDSTSSEAGTTLKSEPIIYPPFQDDLHMNTIKAIQNVSSFEYLANRWMMNDPYLQSYSAERQKQRFDLANLYYLFHGDDWYRNDEWLSYEVSECDWFSQSGNTSILHYDDYPVCDENGTLLKVSLAHNNLHGTMPAFVQRMFTAIRVYDIADNHVHGFVPSGVSNEFLEVFNLANNHLSGRLLESGGFSSFGIRVAKLAGNKVYGSHAAIVRLLHNLEVVDHSSTLLDDLAETTRQVSLHCPHMVELSYRDTTYDGTLPTEIGLLKVLQKLDLSQNAGLVGTIPTELAEMPLLDFVDLSATSLSGEIPRALCPRVEDGSLDLRVNCRQVVCCSKNHSSGL